MLFRSPATPLSFVAIFGCLFKCKVKIFGVLLSPRRRFRPLFRIVPGAGERSGTGSNGESERHGRTRSRPLQPFLGHRVSEKRKFLSIRKRLTSCKSDPQVTKYRKRNLLLLCPIPDNNRARLRRSESARRRKQRDGYASCSGIPA